jgi:methylated-DNA-[protein]-cysteine S-methyltransferase
MPRHAATVCLATPLGLVEIESADSGVTRVRLGSRGRPREVGDGEALARARQAGEEIMAYLAGTLEEFTVPILLTGTMFQRAVWDLLLRIPYGGTRTYGEVAAELGKPRAARAVAAACCANPVPILVPCHRLISSEPHGNGAAGIAHLKRRLLQLEHDQHKERPA